MIERAARDKLLHEITEQVAALLHTRTSVDYECFTPERRAADACITAGVGPRARRYPVVVKPQLNRAGLGPAMAQVRLFGEDALLAAPYINPDLARELRQADQQFVDCAGNAFLRGKNLLVFVTGNKPRTTTPARGQGALGRAGGRIAFALLCKPRLIGCPYRDIAREADVALGTVAAALNSLEAMGHVERTRAGTRRMVRREALFRRWVADYAERWREGFIIARYTAEHANWWQDADIPGCLWGGEVAAFRKTGILRPETITVYGERLPPKVIVAGRLRQDAAGEVELLRRFWAFDSDDPGGPIVPPMLAYADLLAIGGKRNLDAAEVLYGEHIAGRIEQD